MIVLAWILLILIPVLIGLGIMIIAYRKKTKIEIGFADCVVVGFLACIGVAQISHILGFFANMSLDKTGMLFFVLIIGCTIAMSLAGLIGILRKRNICMDSTPCTNMSKLLPLAVLGIFLIQSMFVFCRKPIYISGDIVIETVQSFLANDGIYKVMPLTGLNSETGMPLRYTVLCLPTIYAILADKFNLDAVLVVCHMVPILVLGVSYLAYFRLSETLFGREKLRERYLFLLAFGILLFFSEQVSFLDGYGALHGGYLGTTIRNLIMIPYVISAMLERRYWKAILCILAEACIVWTFYGCGLCLAICLGMLIMDIIERKIPGIRNVLLIFCKKEKQT